MESGQGSMEGRSGGATQGPSISAMHEAKRGQRHLQKQPFHLGRFERVLGFEPP